VNGGHFSLNKAGGEIAARESEFTDMPKESSFELSSSLTRDKPQTQV